jgi:hypothetical protein
VLADATGASIASPCSVPSGLGNAGASGLVCLGRLYMVRICGPGGGPTRSWRSGVRAAFNVAQGTRIDVSEGDDVWPQGVGRCSIAYGWEEGTPDVKLPR